MIGRDKFEQVGGFDERFIVCGGDVELCLRLREKGFWNVMTPYSRVLHHESASRDRQPPDNDIRESLRSYARYLAEGDPFYNPNLTLRDTSCRVGS
jgi:GT2 family glycosyltransferase